MATKSAKHHQHQPKNIAIYCRRSAKDDDKSLSLEQQETSAREYIETHLVGIKKENIHVFRDGHKSGDSLPKQFGGSEKHHRPDLTRLITAIENRQIDTVIIRKRDRLARNLVLALNIFRKFKQYDVQLYCTDEDVQFGDDAASEFGLVIHMAVAEMQLKQMQETTLNAKALARAKKLKMGPVYTIGYKDSKTSPTGIEIDESTKPLVIEIFNRFISGESICQLMRWCNQNHPTAKSRIGEKWYPSTIKRLLSCEHYVGDMVLKKGFPAVPSDGLWTPIIDKSVFAKAQEMLVAQRNSRNYPAKITRHLLSGFLKCGYCKDAKGNPRNMIVYSRFHKKQKIGTEYKCPHCSGKNSSFIMRESRWIEFADLFLSRIKVQSTTNPAGRQTIEAELVRLNGLRKRWLDDLTKGRVDQEEYNEFSAAYRKSKNEFEEKLSVIDAESSREPLVNKMWAEQTFEEKRLSLFQRIKHIEVFKYEAKIVGHSNSVTFPLMVQTRPNQKGGKPMHCLCRTEDADFGSYEDVMELMFEKPNDEYIWWNSYKFNKHYHYADPTAAARRPASKGKLEYIHKPIAIAKTSNRQ